MPLLMLVPELKFVLFLVGIISLIYVFRRKIWKTSQ